MNPAYAIDINQTTFAPARIESISSIVNLAIPLVMTAGALLLLAMLLMAGYNLVIAGPSSENFQKVKEKLFWALFGFGLIATSFFLTRLIGFITNVKIPL